MLIILVEEPSMEAFLKEVIPRIHPGKTERIHWQIIPHEGKDDLKKKMHLFRFNMPCILFEFTFDFFSIIQQFKISKA